MRTFFRERRTVAWLFMGGALVSAAVLAWQSQSVAIADNDQEQSEQSRIRKGFEISPVELDLKRKNRALVGLGSYLVNAQFGCSDCHTAPNFTPGHSPYLGQPEEINAAGYLAGGRTFGPLIVSNNITPDENGLPAGMTFDEFDLVMRTGIDRDHSLPPVPTPGNDLLQVMPWPVFRNVTDRDMRALYEYLRAIPNVP